MLVTDTAWHQLYSSHIPVSHLISESLPHLHNTGSLYVVRKFKWRLLKTPFTLQVLPLITPVSGHLQKRDAQSVGCSYSMFMKFTQ